MEGVGTPQGERKEDYMVRKYTHVSYRLVLAPRESAEALLVDRGRIDDGAWCKQQRQNGKGIVRLGEKRSMDCSHKQPMGEPFYQQALPDTDTKPDGNLNFMSSINL